MTTLPPSPDSGDWQVDGEEFLLNPTFEPDPEPPTEPESKPNRAKGVVKQFAPAVAIVPPPPPEDPPPSAERILEAMLFVGGPPLTAEKACEALRGLNEEQFRDAIKSLSKKYKQQRRPYSLVPQGGGYQIAVKPEYRSLREKLIGGPREARLTQAALDILSLIAYRQPMTKSEIDSMRGIDAGSILRQLVRLGLIAIARRMDNGERHVTYGTTSRFLTLFQLQSLDDLPRLGDTQAIH
ncbi:MAG: SMC-Scp complex subunit ScpB [Gemmataceae bacterium]